jgi:hypothetical protein
MFKVSAPGAQSADEIFCDLVGPIVRLTKPVPRDFSGEQS